jgi:hypothetical protein
MSHARKRAVLQCRWAVTPHHGVSISRHAFDTRVATYQPVAELVGWQYYLLTGLWLALVVELKLL